MYLWDKYTGYRDTANWEWLWLMKVDESTIFFIHEYREYRKCSVSFHGVKSIKIQDSGFFGDEAGRNGRRVVAKNWSLNDAVPKR